MGYLRALWVTAVVFTIACDSSPSGEADLGQAGQSCFPNGTCFGQLICQNDICVVALEDPITPADAAIPPDAQTIPDAGPDPMDGGSLDAGNDTGVDSGPECIDQCSTAGSYACMGADARTICGNFDEDACLEWSVTAEACAGDEVCRIADGACVLSCEGEPCTCADGETIDCANVGRCTDGLRQCVAGEFGECAWSVGPRVEECNGQDDDCNGSTDDGLVPPVCANQRGVCAGSQQACGGPEGWLACTATVYRNHAAATGATFQDEETLCDGLDNDCDGEVDEDPDCCVPSCTGAACGADDGCGGTCLTGSCAAPRNECRLGRCECIPSCTVAACGGSNGCGGTCSTGFCGRNELCNDGSCTCAYVTCDGVCCGAGQTCEDGSCTDGITPSWSEVVSPTSRALNAIWGTSRSNIWAVGDEGVLLYFDGSRWSARTLRTTADLHSIWGSGASDIWIVGAIESSIYPTDAVALHYDGRTWAEATLPDEWSRLSHLWGTGPNDVWARITSYDSRGRFSYSVAHFDGSEWSERGGFPDTLFGPSWGSGPDALWSGTYRFNYYDGDGWTRDPFATPSASFYNYAMWGTAPNNIWSGGDRGRIFYYDGSWIEVSSPTAWSLRAMSGTSSSDIWAVGDRGTILHFEFGWNLETAITDDALYGVWGSSPVDVWAVGTSGTILHYGF